ncbi:MAG: hypothetical protein J5702_07530, partial [Bacteroidales bacterium]|nr:hypothetical protein [Bacteroidales bacterium]
MKKIIALLGIAAFCLAGVSCVKELEESTRMIPEQGTKVTLTVSDEAWVSTRSAYTPGEGVKLTQNEQIGLFYDNGTLLVGNNSYAIKAAPQGAGVYSFTAPEGSLDKTWYAIVPYSHNQARARLNTAKQFHIVFPCTQFPGQNTFDPSTDFLVGKPFAIDAEGARTATIDAFKRLTAPFKLEITGLDPGEKIYAVTFAQSTKASGYNANTGVLNVLAGKCLFKTGAEPDDFVFDSVNPALTRSNNVSAIYDEGLVEESGVWPVWFNVLPGTIARNTQITVTVFTANACYTRTASIGGEAKTFATDKINKMAFNIKGEGYTSEPAISQGFFNNGMDATTSDKTVKLTATDGVERDWEIRGFNWTAAAQDGGSVLPSVLGFPKGVDAYVKLPAVAGSQIKKVRLYLAPVSHLENYAFPLEVYDGETLVATVTNITMLDLSQGYTPGGIVDVPCPEGVSDMAGLTLKFGACTRNANALVSRIVLYTSEAPKPEGDYYQDFLDGKDIVIGNQTYNINDEDLLWEYLDTDDYKKFKSAAMNKDLIFVENSLTINGDNASGITLSRPRPLGIVGRYKEGKGQPFIDLKGKWWYVHGGGLALLNVKMASEDYTHGLINNSGSEIHSCYNIIDCTIEFAQYLVFDQAVEMGAVTSYIIDNSIFAIKYNSNRATMLWVSAGKSDELCPLYRKISATNSVFIDRMTGSAIASFRVFVTTTNCESGKPGNMENLEFTFKNNSLYNLGPRMILGASNAKSVVIDKNVQFGTYSGSDAKTALFRTFSYPAYSDYPYPEPSTSSLSGNWAHFTNATPWVPN